MAVISISINETSWSQDLNTIQKQGLTQHGKQNPSKSKNVNETLRNLINS